MIALRARRAGNEIHQALKVTVLREREFRHLALVHAASGIGSVGLQRRRFGGDLDLLGHQAGLKLEIDPDGGIDRHFHAVADCFAEAGHLNRHAVKAGGQIGDRVGSRFGGLQRAGEARVEFDGGDLGVLNDGAGCVGDGSENGAVKGLAPRRGGEESECDEKAQCRLLNEAV